MLILLPPSEGKTPAVRGSGVDWPSLSFPQLNPCRAKVLEALGTVSAHEDALALLGVGASLKDDVERNTRLHAEPAAPAHQIYSGVLYDALGYRTLTPAQRRKADASVLVVSALWGAIRFGDSVPAYRLSMGTALPDVGRLASFWKPHLSNALAVAASGELLVDCRSSTYAAAWAPPPARTVTVNVFTEVAGVRKVVSHFAKHTRGELARHLLARRGKTPATPSDLLQAAREKWDAELVEGTARKPHALNIILPG
ncbi:peroxide stress protein YaaA [Pseudarthrobacter phenanthrenivorans]|uniref:YaaA family protein n=1 Tax=Pseudarthrobacter phenanthrenivorans TaxID=361575 RepID=UPI00112C6298|nr:peroxide stress protein YaaA [Pseudarthrobacter phenanthrenivorans]TPV53047.1 peroxide stress protein YaaA [Pseudarthrobacter phenanthrenivorans]